MMHGSAMMLPVPLGYVANGVFPQRGKTTLSGRYACYNVYPARDGRYVAVGALEPKFWAVLCRALGLEQLIDDQFADGARSEEVLAALSAKFLERDAEQWFADLKHLDACVTPVRTVEEAARDWNLLAAKDGRAPALGEHNPV
ncbi:MAG: CoA transferase, partial [Candidatus Solibacter usitatus]|nr:CoA transferase [Candidatus Solibacter usitatus]